jgi:hypothetical protein
MHVKTKGTSLQAGTLLTLPIFLIIVFTVSIRGHLLVGTARADGIVATSASVLAPEPWRDAQVVKSADLAKEIADAKGTNRPVVVCSGFQVLYEGAHVSGAVFHGPASNREGLDDLKRWAQGIPRSSNVVVYCGCCPFDHCPNIRPAFEMLHSMGFQHLRVLMLSNNFAQDWVSQGYPVEKGR